MAYPLDVSVSDKRKTWKGVKEMSKRFDRLVQHIRREYEEKGMSPERANAIAEATAGKIAREKESDNKEAAEDGGGS
jgi:predicted transcriptional regulator